jgi:hypothetical protein
VRPEEVGGDGIDGGGHRRSELGDGDWRLPGSSGLTGELRAARRPGGASRLLRGARGGLERRGCTAAGARVCRRARGREAERGKEQAREGESNGGVSLSSSRERRCRSWPMTARRRIGRPLLRHGAASAPEEDDDREACWAGP